MIRQDLAALLGPAAVVGADDDATAFLTEWRGQVRGQASVIVRPDTTDGVVQLVRYCAGHNLTIVAQGGNTGLCGGAIPTDPERTVLLSLARMNSVIDVSASDNALTVEAGCTLAAAQTAATEAGRYFPLSLAAEGSATIGGNLSTNAGGIHVLRYGTARDLTLGLEVVLADGTVWNGLRSLRKNTAGYDLRQLFIGAEGTLGIITKAVLKLHPRPTQTVTAFAALDGVAAALDLYHRLDAALPAGLQAFELISAQALTFVLEHIPATRRPLHHAAPYFVLLDMAGGSSGAIEETLVRALAAASEAGIVRDVAVAASLAQKDAFWRLRHSISEAQRYAGASLKHDIALPLSQLAAFHADTAAELERLCPGLRPCVFGHVGDGNLHYNLSRPESMSDSDFQAFAEPLSNAVYECVDRYGGTISAEHGIGLFKRDLLAAHLPATDLTIMRALKQALDPQGLFNPGKLLPDANAPATVVPVLAKSVARS